MPSCPWFKFYSADFLADTRHLSLRDKGAWIDLLCYMDRANPRGTIDDTLEGFARRWSCSVDEADAILQRLDGVALQKRYNPPPCNARTSVTELRVCITSRRMVKDTAEREATYNRVNRHRTKGKAEPSDDSATNDAIHKIEPCNAFVTGRSQKLDARYTNPLSPPLEKGGTNPASLPIQTQKRKRARTPDEKAARALGLEVQ
jgi:hypothetical protein